MVFDFARIETSRHYSSCLKEGGESCTETAFTIPRPETNIAIPKPLQPIEFPREWITLISCWMSIREDRDRCAKDGVS